MCSFYDPAWCQPGTGSFQPWGCIQPPRCCCGPLKSGDSNVIIEDDGCSCCITLNQTLTANSVTTQKILVGGQDDNSKFQSLDTALASTTPVVPLGSRLIQNGAEYRYAFVAPGAVQGTPVTSDTSASNGAATFAPGVVLPLSVSRQTATLSLSGLIADPASYAGAVLLLTDATTPTKRHRFAVASVTAAMLPGTSTVVAGQGVPANVTVTNPIAVVASPYTVIPAAANDPVVGVAVAASLAGTGSYGWIQVSGITPQLAGTANGVAAGVRVVAAGAGDVVAWTPASPAVPFGTVAIMNVALSLACTGL